MRALAAVLLAGLTLPALLSAHADGAASPLLAREVLGRPTDHSVTVRALADQPLEVGAEWGTRPGAYTASLPAVRFPAGVPIALVLDGLTPDTTYYWRLRTRADGAPASTAGEEHRFHTARPAGRPFTFVIQADPHMDESSSADVYAQTLANMLADAPDFVIDLGDSSMADKCSIQGSNVCGRPAPASYDAVLSRNLLARAPIENLAHSAPLFMVLGNHEGEAGWLDDGTPDNLAAWNLRARKLLFANPAPDGFYSGNVEGRENYYAFEWGDALLVMLDPFAATTRKPTRATDDEMWRWTLGEAQYRWLRRTLEVSGARHKLVFSHHMVGSATPEVRGGAAFARTFEWGGRNFDGSWGFDERRPGWGKPIHQVMVDTGVGIWFHGHDHVYAAEELDGIVYQEVPQPSLARYEQVGPAAEYGYLGTPGVNVFASSGHLRVSVSPAEVRVEYVRSVPPRDETATRRNAAVLHAYTVRR